LLERGMIESCISFPHFLISCIPINLKYDGLDKFCWNPSKRGLFDVRLFYYV
jgi:hypothetical protein